MVRAKYVNVVFSNIVAGKLFRGIVASLKQLLPPTETGQSHEPKRMLLAYSTKALPPPNACAGMLSAMVMTPCLDIVTPLIGRRHSDENTPGMQKLVHRRL